MLVLTAIVCLVSVTRTVTREPTVILLLSSSSKTGIKEEQYIYYTSAKHFFSNKYVLLKSWICTLIFRHNRNNLKILLNKSLTTSNILSGWELIIQQTIKKQHWVWNFNCMEVRKFKVIATVGTIILLYCALYILKHKTSETWNTTYDQRDLVIFVLGIVTLIFLTFIWLTTQFLCHFNNHAFNSFLSRRQRKIKEQQWLL